MAKVEKTNELKQKKAKIIFSDGSSYEIETEGFNVKIDTITSQVKTENINWNDDVTIVYQDGRTTCKGRINEEGKLNRECDIIKYNEQGDLTDITESYFIDGKTAEVKKELIEEENGKPVFEEVYYDEIIKKVKYTFEDENPSKISIDYDEINRALNRNEINTTDDLKKYIKMNIYNDEKLVDKKECNLELIKKCAEYQMQTKLKSSNNDELDDEKRINGGSVSLQNLIILAEVSNNIEALKKIRFELECDNPDWPTNIYENKELFLNSLGLTKNNPTKDENLVPIDTLLENNIDYFSVNMSTTKSNHSISSIIDLNKIKNNEKNFIYTYDATRVIDVPRPAKVIFGDLGGLQEDCQIFNNFQQNFGSCWYHASCFTITAAEHPEIFEKIKKGEIKPIPFGKNLSIKLKQLIGVKTEFNDIEKLQMATLQKIAEDFRVEKFGEVKKRMIHQIVDKPTRNMIKKEAMNHINNSELLKNLDFKLGTTMALFIVNEKNELLKGTDKKPNDINKKLKEIKANSLEEVDKKLLEEATKNKINSDESLNRINEEIESLGLFTKIELLKRVEKAKIKENNIIPPKS